MELVKHKRNKWIMRLHIQVEGEDFDEVFDKLEDLEKLINKQKSIKVMSEVYG